MLVISAYRSTGTEGASLKDKVGETFFPNIWWLCKVVLKLSGKGKIFKKLYKLTEYLSGGRE